MLITPDFSKDIPYHKEAFQQDSLIVAYLSKEEMNSFLKEYNMDEQLLHNLSDPDPLYPIRLCEIQIIPFLLSIP